LDGTEVQILMKPVLTECTVRPTVSGYRALPYVSITLPSLLS